MNVEYVIVALLAVIAIFLYNIQHFCKGIKRDIFEIKTCRNWDDKQ